MAAGQLTPTYLEQRREARPCCANTVCSLSLHPSEQWKCSRPHGANDVSQYGGIANRRVALAEAMGDVNNNLNAGCTSLRGVLSCFMADGGQVERFVVVSPCREHRAIVQSRCLGLTGTDMHFGSATIH